MLGGLNRPLFAWSGGNAGVNAVIAESDLIDLSAQRGGAGLLPVRAAAAARTTCSTTPTSLFAQAPPEAGRPTPLFVVPRARRGAHRRRRHGRRADGRGRSRCAGSGTRPSASTCARRTAGPTPSPTARRSPRTTSSCSANEYGRASSDAISPEAQSVGDGRRVPCSPAARSMRRAAGARADRTSPIDPDDAGRARRSSCTPGRTWVEMADVADHGDDSAERAVDASRTTRGQRPDRSLALGP